MSIYLQSKARRLQHLCKVSSECDVDCVCVQRVSDMCTSSNIITAG